MFSRRLKTGYFVVEGLNSFGVVYYFYYFYFFMQRTFGFDNKANLTLAALNGAVYALGSWWAGRFAQRFGYFTALKVGLFVMLASLGAGSQLTTAPAHIAVMLVTVVGMCFTWPALEALVSEGEPAAAGLQQMIGVYNIVWASTAAAANFTGGAMFEHLGARSLFYVPICIQVTQLLLILWLEKQAHRRMAVAPSCNPSARTPGEPETGVQCRSALRQFGSGCLLKGWRKALQHQTTERPCGAKKDR